MRYEKDFYIRNNYAFDRGVFMFGLSGCFGAKHGSADNDNSNGALLTFSSFDGGGPEYDVIIDDAEIVGCEQVREYYDRNHDEMCGSGYEVIITFVGKKPGKTTAKIECRSPIAENFDYLYDVEVKEDLSVVLNLYEQTEIF